MEMNEIGPEQAVINARFAGIAEQQRARAATPPSGASPDDLRRLAQWWRQCHGSPDFKAALNHCAGQLERVVNGDLPGIGVLERWTRRGVSEHEQREPAARERVAEAIWDASQPHDEHGKRWHWSDASDDDLVRESIYPQADAAIRVMTEKSEVQRKARRHAIDRWMIAHAFVAYDDGAVDRLIELLDACDDPDLGLSSIARRPGIPLEALETES